MKGEVIITIEKPEDIKCILVEIFGGAHVMWTVHSGSGSSRRTRRYTNTITYIKESSIVWSKENSLSGELPIGEHTFPFEYQLPQNIPPSFESIIGQVRYEIRTVVSRSGFLTGSLKANALFSVRENTNLSTLCMEPKIVDLTNPVKFFCFDFGSVSVTCNLPSTGFTPGDIIPIDLQIENQTTKTVRIRTSLYKVNIFTSSGGRKRVVGHHESLLMSPQVQAAVITSVKDRSSLKIPTEAPTTLRSCSCISVEYSIVIKVIAALGSSIDKKIPIVIANKPFVQPVVC